MDWLSISLKSHNEAKWIRMSRQKFKRSIIDVPESDFGQRNLPSPVQWYCRKSDKSRESFPIRMFTVSLQQWDVFEEMARKAFKSIIHGTVRQPEIFEIFARIHFIIRKRYNRNFGVTLKHSPCYFFMDS